MMNCPSTNPLRARWAQIPGVIYPEEKKQAVRVDTVDPKKWISSKEVAALLGCSLSAARTRLHAREIENMECSLERGQMLFWNRAQVEALMGKEPPRGKPEGMLTTREACEKLGVGRTTLMRYERNGKLHVQRRRVLLGDMGYKVCCFFNAGEIEALAGNAPKKAERAAR